jgi:hypothetical protein
MKYRIYIATQVAFPTTAQALENAVMKYNMSGDEFAVETESERENIPVADTGRLQVVSTFCICAYSLCVIFNNNFQTYNVGATIRGELKTHGRTIVLREYKITPSNADELSEKEKRKAVRENVAPLLLKGAWAHAPAARVIQFITHLNVSNILNTGREKADICPPSSESSSVRLLLYWPQLRWIL